MTFTGIERVKVSGRLIEEVRRLWDEGVATMEIGRRVGRTKNSVVSIAHRNNFPPRPNPVRRPPPLVEPNAPRLARAREPAPSARPVLPPMRPSAPSAQARPLPLVQPKTCQWPLGEPGQPGFAFCGKPRDGGQWPYCAAHHRVAARRPGAGEEA